MSAEGKPAPKFGTLLDRLALNAVGTGEALRERERKYREAESEHRRALLMAAGKRGAVLLETVDAAKVSLEDRDPAMRRAALYLLINHWNVDEDDAKNCALHKSNDPDPEVRKEAIEFVGQLYRRSNDRHIARTLAQMVADEGESDEIRRAAYASLRNVIGRNVVRYGPPSLLRIPGQVDWDLVSACIDQRQLPVPDEDDIPFDERLASIRSRLFPSVKCDDAFRAGDYATAIECYSKVLVSHPEAHQICCMRGCAHGNLGNLQAAIADITAAIEMYSEEPIYYVERSKAYRLLSQNDLADADARRAAELEKRRSS